MDSKPQSIYHNGATDGLIMGLYFSVIFILQALTLGRPSLLGLVGTAMLLGIPVLAYMQLRRGYRQHPANRQFATVWMHGITIFVCAGLILGVVQYAYTRFLVPNFIPDMMHNVAEAYKSMPGAKYQHFGSVLQNMIDQKLVPSSISLAFSMIWTVSFAGSLLSLLLTIIIKLFGSPKAPKQEE